MKGKNRDAVHVVSRGRLAQTRTPDSQLFRNLFNAMPVGIAIETLEGQPLFVNPALCSFLGFSEQELLCKHCVDFSPTEDAEKDSVLFQQLRDGLINHYKLEKRYFRRDGSLVWGSLIVSFLNNSPAPLVVAMVEDISERKKAEEARLRLAAIVESSADAIISKNLDAVIVSWNAGAEHLFGYTAAEAIGQPITIIIPPELRDEETRMLDRLRAGGRIEHYETVRVTKTGRKVHVSLMIGPVKDAGGNTMGFSKIAHDITQRKQHEQTLKESEERFRLVADSAPVMIWMSGTNKLCNYFNKTWLDFTGRSMEMEVGNGWAEGVHSDDLERCLDTYTQSFDKREKFRMEYRLRRHDGQYCWVLDVGVPRFNPDSSFAGYIGIAIDVTERRMAEEALVDANRVLKEHAGALQAREELLKIFVQNVPAGVAMLDREMRYLELSDRFCADYGIERSQVLRRSHYDVFPEIPIHWREVHRRAFQGETLRSEEERWERGGSTVWVRWEVRPWQTAAGTVGGILIFAEDITRRKEMEEAFSQMSRKLIESQEQDRARIGRDLHDDINQRLAMLAVEIDQLRSDSRVSSVKIKNRLKELRSRINGVATDVQSISHQLHSPQLELLGVVGAIRSFCREFAARQKVEIDFTHDNVPEIISADVSLCLFRVIQEALHNAVKHSNVRHYEVKLARSASTLHLRVSDHGTGFDESSAIAGRGLGLVSMRERVRLVNGTILIESKPMAGTIIDVRVPFRSEHFSQQSAS